MNNEDYLDVSETVEWREVEYDVDMLGKRVYRHVIYTEWQEVPDE